MIDDLLLLGIDWVVGDHDVAEMTTQRGRPRVRQLAQERGVATGLRKQRCCATKPGRECHLSSAWQDHPASHPPCTGSRASMDIPFEPMKDWRHQRSDDVSQWNSTRRCQHMV
eukprot:8918958-Pyramimonas_sp.AAC.1